MAAADGSLLLNSSFDWCRRYGVGPTSYANSTIYPFDNWFLTGTTNASGVTVQRSTDAPVGEEHSALVTIGTGAAETASRILLFCTRTEGLQSGNLRFGDPSAPFMALSFGMKLNQTGQMIVHLRHNSASSSWTMLMPFQYSVASAWQDFSLVLPADVLNSTLVDDTEATNSFTLGWSLGSGTNDMGAALNAWNHDTKHSFASQLQLTSFTGGTFQLSRPKLEAADVPSRYVRRDVGTELANLMRVLQASYEPNTPVGTASTPAGKIQVPEWGTAAGAAVFSVNFPMPMRKAPTSVTVYSPGTGTAGKAFETTGAADINATVSNISATGFTVTTASFTPSAGGAIELHYFADAQV